MCTLSRFSRVPLCATPWAVACEAPLTMGFSRQECWSVFPCLPGVLPHRPCELEMLVSTCGQVVIIGNVHKVAVLLHANSGSICNQILRESRLPGWWIRVECAWANTQGPESQYFFPLKLHPSPPDSVPGERLPAEAPRRLSGRRRQLGTPAPGDLVPGEVTLVLKTRGSGHHCRGALGILVPARGNQYRLKRSLYEEHLAGLSWSHPSLALGL